MRDNFFLKQRLDHLWKEHFSDVPKSNRVDIRFGRCAEKRLGSIRQRIDHTDTLIMLNGHFRDKKIPNYIIDATIVHELCHYAYGFSSPLPQLSKFPHRGGVVKKELLKRGLGELLEKETSWLNKNWTKYLKENSKHGARTL